jgi:hypothetical protein
MENTTDYDLGLFLGTETSYENFKRKNHLRDEEDEQNSRNAKLAKKETKVSNLSFEDSTGISEENLLILKRTRWAHPYEEVYMQSSIDFYDSYYNDMEASPEMIAARQIRRVYRDYSDYLDAVEVRNRYIDTIIDRYGGEDEFQRKLNLGFVTDWIPPMPTLSKKCQDYDLYRAGIEPTEEYCRENAFNETLSAFIEYAEDADIIYEDGVMDNIGEVSHYLDGLETYTGTNYFGSNQVSKLEELNETFRSWYKPEKQKNYESELFCDAPENIRKRYMEQSAYNHPGLLTQYMDGTLPEEPKPNPNEMVRDEVTGRSMTRKELEQREFIRLMKEAGWSESRLMNYLNVGSRLDRSVRKRRPSKKKKKSIDNIMSGDELNGIDPVYIDSEESDAFFVNALNAMMKGEF